MHRKAAAGLLTQTVLVWGLIFLGWGLDDLGGFFAHPARTGLLVVTILGSTVVLLSATDIDPFRKGNQTVQRQRWVLASAVGLMLFLGWFLPFADRRDLLVFRGADLLRYLGLGLCSTGGTLRWVAMRTLGRQFSGYVTLQENHQLVQSGIYRHIRHPIYLGTVLTFPGWALIFRSWLAVPALVLTTAFVAARIRQEEKLLQDTFGADFEAYRRRTWRLIPHLY